MASLSPEVFICHSAEDKPAADQVCAALEAEGVRCWIAPRDVRAGAVWAEAITEAIDGSKVMVIVISADTIKSQHQVIREIELADSRNTALLPVLIENVTLSKGLEYYLKNRHWIDAFTPPLEHHLPSVVSAVRQLLTGEVQPVPPPPPVRSEPPQKKSWTWLIIGAAALLIVALALIAYNGYFRGGRDNSGAKPAASPVITPAQAVTPTTPPRNDNRLVAPPSPEVTRTRRLAAPETLEPRCRTTIALSKETLHFKWLPVEGASSYTVEWDCLGCGSHRGWNSQLGRPWMIREGVGLRTTSYTSDDIYNQFKRERALVFRWRVWAVDSKSVEGIKSDWCQLAFARNRER